MRDIGWVEARDTVIEVDGDGYLAFVVSRNWTKGVAEGWGLEGCSIALGMVIAIGHMETHPEVKEAFQQRNVYDVPEDEFLEMMEMACRPRGSVKAPSEHDPLSVAHMITGMKPSKLAVSGITYSWLRDPRFHYISAAVEKISKATTTFASPKLATSSSAILASAIAT
jgi:hypothetical protein